MSDDVTAFLSLPLLQPSQAQKYVTHNEALTLLDMLVQLVVQSRDKGAPSEEAMPGDRCIVGPDAVGAFAGKEGQIAVMTDAGWRFVVPLNGWRAYVIAEARDVVRHNGSWQAATELSPIVGLLGVGATPDMQNPLAVSGPATLFTHDGTDHRVKVNKAGATNTATVLFQSGWSGRAEMGLSGSDAFEVKVSADGDSFRTALRANPATGAVDHPHGLTSSGPVRVDGALTGRAVTQSASDTTAGRLTKVGDFGIGRIRAEGSGQSVNASTLAGGLHVGVAAEDPSARGLSNYLVAVPGGVDTGLLAWSQTGNAASPFFGQRSASGAVTWDRAITMQGLVGNVSQAAGIPTGAVIESGSNASGFYVRFADGTQICWGTFTVGPVNVRLAFGGGFRSSEGTVAFAAQFLTPPVVQASVQDVAASGALILGPGAVYTTSFGPRLWRPTAADGVTCVGCFTAIGRWF